MKPTFIELTENKEKVLINLDNVIEIVPGKGYTSLYTNCSNTEGVSIITVEQSYDVIKRWIESQI